MFNSYAKLQEVHQITHRTTGNPDLVLSAGGMTIVQPIACMLLPPENQNDACFGSIHYQMVFHPQIDGQGHTFRIVGFVCEHRKRRV
jgi:hypothetical protein